MRLHTAAAVAQGRMINFGDVITHKEDSELSLGRMEVDRLLSSTASADDMEASEGTYIGEKNNGEADDQISMESESEQGMEECAESEMEAELTKSQYSLRNDYTGADSRCLTNSMVQGDNMENKENFSEFKNQTAKTSLSSEMNEILYKSLSNRTNEWDKYACSECNADYTKLHRLQEHINGVHYNIMRHNCPHSECTYKTNRGHDLKRHIQRMHMSSRPF